MVRSGELSGACGRGTEMAKKTRKKKKNAAKDGIPVDPYGTMYLSIDDGGPLFLRESVGTARAEDGTEYELTTNVANAHPIVASSKTGRRFVLSWQDIIRMAQQSGIDECDTVSR